jgi:hypothetical protein
VLLHSSLIFSFSDVVRLALVLDERLDDLELQEFHADSDRMRRATELRQLLGDQNPFNVHHTPEIAAGFLRSMLESLHQPNSPFERFSDILFPVLLVPHVDRACAVPFCPLAACVNDDVHWQRLHGDLLDFIPVEVIPTSLSRCCGEEPQARSIPRPVMDDVETGTFSFSLLLFAFFIFSTFLSSFGC